MNMLPSRNQISNEDIFLNSSLVSAWLNRIGIILNFLAGFMVAPELIGVERINNIEKRVESSIKNINKNSQSALTKIKKYLQTFNFVTTTILIILFLIGNLYFFSSGESIVQQGKQWAYLGFLVSGFISMFLGIRFSEKPKTPKDRLASIISNYVTLLIVLTPLINIVVIATIAIPAILAVFIQGLLFITLKTTAHLLNTLKGDEKLRKFLVGLGISFLVIGNLLQLIATF